MFYYLGNSNSLNTYSTIINLFAIQPKSIQEGQLIIPSPEQSTKEQLIEKKIEPKNKFPKPPTLDILMDAIDISQDNTKGNCSMNFKIKVSNTRWKLTWILSVILNYHARLVFLSIYFTNVRR